MQKCLCGNICFLSDDLIYSLVIPRYYGLKMNNTVLLLTYAIQYKDIFPPNLVLCVIIVCKFKVNTV